MTQAEHGSAHPGEPVIHRVVVDRMIYGTITMMCVLIVYDGWSKLELLDVLGVIAGPIIAMFVSHIFAAVLAQQVKLSRDITKLRRFTWCATSRGFSCSRCHRPPWWSS